MEWMPALKLVWLGGWILIIFSSSIQWLLMLSMPREVFSRLFNRNGWSKKQRTFFRLGKVFGIVCLVLTILTPLKLHSPWFIAGISVYSIGLIGLIVSILNYRDTLLDQPVTKGLYQISRHPQIVSTTMIVMGICLAIGSWSALTVLTIARIFEHYGVLAEEEACLEQYGESYRLFMVQVPRYFLFF